MEAGGIAALAASTRRWDKRFGFGKNRQAAAEPQEVPIVNLVCFPLLVFRTNRRVFAASGLGSISYMPGTKKLRWGGRSASWKSRFRARRLWKGAPFMNFEMARGWTAVVRLDVPHALRGSIGDGGNATPIDLSAISAIFDRSAGGMRSRGGVLR